MNYILPLPITMILKYNKKLLNKLLKRSPKVLLLLLLVILLYAAGSYVYNTLTASGAEILAFPVGKGDCFAIRLKSNQNILIDCGSSDINNVAETIVIPQLTVNGISKIYAVIVTHDDSDHTNGLKAIIDTYHPKYIICVDEAIEKNTLSFAGRSKKYKNTEFLYVRAGDKLQLDDDTTLTFLYPLNKNIKGFSKNNRSIVTRLDHKNSSALFTGDLEFIGENILLTSRYRDLLDVDVLKVAHHGSRGSTSEQFLKATSPKIGIISCSKANFNYYHPHQELLDRLAKYNVTILRTNEMGVIKLKTNGNGWSY